jgi:peroxiredoxin
MAINEGDKLPAATFKVMTDEGPGDMSSADLFAGKKVALFAVPGAFTPTCHLKHLPSFVDAAKDLSAKGVDAIACISVNDPFVMKAWGEDTGASGAGIHMIADPDAAFTKAIGMDFDGSGAGLGIRSKRYSMFVDDGVVQALNVEEAPGQATVTLGGAMVDQI